MVTPPVRSLPGHGNFSLFTIWFNHWFHTTFHHTMCFLISSRRHVKIVNVNILMSDPNRIKSNNKRGDQSRKYRRSKNQWQGYNFRRISTRFPFVAFKDTIRRCVWIYEGNNDGYNLSNINRHKYNRKKKGKNKARFFERFFMKRRPVKGGNNPKYQKGRSKWDLDKRRLAMAKADIVKVFCKWAEVVFVAFTAVAGDGV